MAGLDGAILKVDIWFLSEADFFLQTQKLSQKR